MVQHLLGYEEFLLADSRVFARLDVLILRPLDHGLLDELLHWVRALLALNTALQE